MPKRKTETNVVPFQNAGLPANPEDFASALGNVHTATGPSKDILKMTKGGEWLFGADGLDVEPGTFVAFNPFTFQHGGVFWDDDGKKQDERMAPITVPDPMIADALPRDQYDAQMSIEGTLIGGDDDGTEVIYSTSSKGGMEAMGKLARQLGTQMGSDPANCVPVVELGNSHYNHKTYGRIYKPVLDVVRWAGMEEKPEAEDATSEEEPANPPTRRRRRR